MTDTRGSATLADVVETGPELRGVRPAGPDSFAPPVSSGELLHAYRVQGRAYRTDFDEIMLRDGYAPILDELGLRQSQNPAAFFDNDQAHEPVLMRSDILARQGGSFLSSMADRRTQESLIAGEIRARRSKDNNFLAGVPDTVEGLHQYFRDAEARKRQASSGTIARGPGGWRQALTGLAGQGIETFHDPFNIATLPIGGGGKTLVQVAARETLLNGLLEAATLPSAAHNLDELGEHLTVGEAVSDVVTAGVFGGVLEGTIHVGRTHIPPALFKAMPESVQRRWADRMKVGQGKDAPLLKDVLGDMDNRELGAFARGTIAERMTPDERAAADTLEREQELGEASPFHGGPAGDAAHQQGLTAALQAIIDGAPRATGRALLLGSSSLTAPSARPAHVNAGPASVPHDIVDFFRGKGLSEGQAYGIAAGIVAESRADHGAVNPTSGALGLGQWLGARKGEIVRRYGPNPSRQQQLEFLWHELSGGDAGGRHVLAEHDPGRVLDAYIRKFMRPAAGAETMGDLERGMAALGRGGELPERAAGADAGDEDLVAALRRDADEAESEALELSQVHEDADLGQARELDAADYPILKRELFDSDQDWLEAQVEFYHSLNAENAPQSPGNGPPAREVASGPAEVAETAPGARGEASALGPEYPELAGDWGAAVARLQAEGRGVVPGALEHPEIGLIDAVWGEAGTGRSDGFGIAKIARHHPEVLTDLPEIVASMEIKSRNANRIQLEGPDHRGAVRLDYDGAARTWLLTAFAKDAKHLPEKAPPLPDDRRGSVGGRDGSPDRGADANIVPGGPIDNPELKAFDQGSDGRKLQVDSLEHDARMAALDPERAERRYQLSEDGPHKTLAEILDELDADRAAAEALRSCTAPGGAM